MKTILALILSAFVVSALASDSGEQKLSLARRLWEEGDNYGAALELRRTALDWEDARDSLLWLAGWHYLRAGRPETARKMAHEAENAGAPAAEAAVLHGAIAGTRREWQRAAFFYETAAETAKTEKLRDAARMQGAATLLRAGELEQAGRQYSAAGVDYAAEVIADYRQGPRRRPWLGGVLGLVPGLGYAYSGEYANATRSLLLNSLFIFAMVETAGNDNWGAFAAAGFFELTWYSGSIYGGIDAAHRFNRRQLESAIERLPQPAISPDPAALPLLNLRIDF